MTTFCQDVKTLLGSYLDGELSEEQAAPLRTHLLACAECREGMQEVKVIRRWFHQGRAPVQVPAGFAARVARRAFAGDPGLLQPTPPAHDAPGEARLVTFLLGLTAAAAALLFAFSLLIQGESLPQDDRLKASERFWEEEALEPPPVPDPEDATDSGDRPERR